MLAYYNLSESGGYQINEMNYLYQIDLWFYNHNLEYKVVRWIDSDYFSSKSSTYF